MTIPATLHDGLLIALPSLGAGIALGLAYFAMLKVNVRIFCEGKPLVAVLLQASRFVLAVAVLGTAVHFGALALLTCTLGFLGGRWLSLRHLREVRS